MNASSWRADGFDGGLSDVLGCVNDALDQALSAIWESAGGAGGRARSHDRAGRGGGRDSGRSGGAPWDRGFGTHDGRGHWGGGAGAWGGWWPGPPGAQRGSKAGRGDVRAATLALLSEGPRTGYQIMSDIKERSGGAWRPSPGAVYPALSALADEGLIAGEESGGRRTFSLTAAGRDYIAQNPDMARPAWESAAQQEAWEVPGLFAEATRLGGGIVQVAHSGTPEQVLAAERLLERTRRELYQILADDVSAEQDDE